MIQNSISTQRRNNYTDHLDSSSWITDADGRAIQYFGEPWVKERAVYSSWETPYTFSGKERDEETGYSYFGARYYDSDLSTWLSVDPLADKYPNWSPYNYCLNNPIKLIDPDGRECSPIYDLDGNFMGTDDQGLQGDAIVMKRSDFKQGMSHKEAISKSTELNTN